MKHIAAHTFRGKRYKLRWRKLPTKSLSPKIEYVTYGTCDGPATEGKLLTIDPNLKGIELLEALLDESLHACHWDLDNTAIDETSRDQAKFLWRIGYRLD